MAGPDELLEEEEPGAIEGNRWGCHGLGFRFLWLFAELLEEVMAEGAPCAVLLRGAFGVFGACGSVRAARCDRACFFELLFPVSPSMPGGGGERGLLLPQQNKS